MTRKSCQWKWVTYVIFTHLPFTALNAVIYHPTSRYYSSFTSRQCLHGYAEIKLWEYVPWFFLSFRTDRSGQTVQNQIRLLLIRVYTMCHSLCIVWKRYFKEKPSCSIFRVITANFRVSEILGFLRYSSFFLLRRRGGIPANDKDKFKWNEIQSLGNVIDPYKLRFAT